MNPTDKINEIRNSDKEALFQEILYQRYLSGRTRMQDIFDRISIAEYLLLFHLREKKKADASDGRIYLAEIAEKMEVSTTAASKMARELKDRGLVTWSHDGKGEEGTYVELSQTGEDLLNKQEQTLREYYSRVIDQFGEEKTYQLLLLTREMRQTMGHVYEEMEQEQN